MLLTDEHGSRHKRKRTKRDEGKSRNGFSASGKALVGTDLAVEIITKPNGPPRGCLICPQCAPLAAAFLAPSK
jgi:hypothetical protein